MYIWICAFVGGLVGWFLSPTNDLFLRLAFVGFGFTVVLMFLLVVHPWPSRRRGDKSYQKKGPT